jgi:hypothetical protein
MGRAALALLPVLSALCIWSLSLRIEQYGWTTDRVWAALLVGITSLYAVGYAVSALMRGWLPALGIVNTWIALVLIASVLAIHTPLLDPQRISATSQVARLLAGKVEIDRFDYNYVRFNLGRAGDSALKELTELTGHPHADAIRSKAKEAQERKNRYTPNQQPNPSKAEITGKLAPYPAGTVIDPAFVDYLYNRLTQNKDGYALASLKGSKVVPLVAINLGGGDAQEYVLMVRPYAVFASGPQGWRQVGQINFTGAYIKDEDVEKLVQKGEFSALPRQWSDLKLGDKVGNLILRQE